jgi:hypothetical protein
MMACMAAWVRFDQPWWLLAAFAAAVPVLLAARRRSPRAGGKKGTGTGTGRQEPSSLSSVPSVERPAQAPKMGTGTSKQREGQAPKKGTGTSKQRWSQSPFSGWGLATPFWAVGMQCLAVLAAAVALAGPALRMREKGQLSWLILRDVSASTRGQDSNCSCWPAEVPHAEVEFAQDVLGPSGPDQAARAGQAAAPTRTLIRPPLQLALGRSRDLAGVVVVSDGQWHDDRWEDAAGALRQAGLSVLVVPLDEPPPDARLAEFRAIRRADGGGGPAGGGAAGAVAPDGSPGRWAASPALAAGAGGTVDLYVTLAANSPQTRTLTVRRQGEGKPIFEKEVQLLPGEGFTLTERLRDEPPADLAGLPIRYRAELSAGDAVPENDAASATAPPVIARTAIVAGEPGAGLLPPGAGVEAVAPPLAPRSADGWAPFSCVVLCDPDGSLLEPAQRSALEQYVREGGGLVVVGTGPARTEWAGAAAPSAALGLQDPLNRVAALVPNPYERRPLRVVVVLDSSGSMAEAPPPAATGTEGGPAGGGPSGGASGGRAGARKFDLAVEAVASMRRHLTPRDSLAVITFSDTPRRVYDSEDLGAAARSKAGDQGDGRSGAAGGIDFVALREALAKVEPGGPTIIAPALEEAVAATAAGTGPAAGTDGMSPAGGPPPRPAGGAAGNLPEGRERLVIVVSDLAAKPFDEEKMARSFRSRGLWLAVVEVRSAAPAPTPSGSAGPGAGAGEASDAGEPEGPSATRSSLRTLAKMLAAPLVPQEDLAGLAEVFGGFIRRARGDIVRRGDFRLEPARAARPGEAGGGESRPGEAGAGAPGPGDRGTVPAEVFGQDISRLPAVGGYVLSAAQEGAEVQAVIGEDPVIARRGAGLGRSVSIALPVVAALNADLSRAGEFGRLLAGAAEWARRLPNDPRFSCDLSRGGGQVRLRVEAEDAAGPMNLRKLTARLIAVGGEGAAGGGRNAEPREVPLEQVAPGRYEAGLGEAEEPIGVEVVGGDRAAVWRGTWGASYAEEFAAIGPDWANLQRLASLTGGRIVPMGSLSATGRDLVSEGYKPVAAALLAIAAALMLIEWAAVRIVRK